MIVVPCIVPSITPLRSLDYGANEGVGGTATAMGRLESSNSLTAAATKTAAPYLGGSYFERQGNLVRRSVMGITGVTIWAIGVINNLLSPLDPPPLQLWGNFEDCRDVPQAWIWHFMKGLGLNVRL